jgi:hypothetical protein
MSPEEFIKELAYQLAEKRSDISELCTIYLESGESDFRRIEHRFISARIPGTAIQVEYDTLTTEMEFSEAGALWEPCIDHKYHD